MEPHVEVVLSKLESLSSQDRRWLIERLPESAKAILMGGRTQIGVKSAVNTSATTGASSLASPNSLAEFSPMLVAQVLGNEPGWIIEALLRNGDATWRKQVLRHLPTSTRSSVMSSTHAAIHISKPVQDSMLRTARRKLESNAQNAMSNDQSPWQRLTAHPLFNWIRT